MMWLALILGIFALGVVLILADPGPRRRVVHRVVRERPMVDVVDVVEHRPRRVLRRAR